MKYKCLVLDHDDTVVASSEAIHYPSFIAYLEDYRPELVNNYTFESFIIKNFDPGIVSLLHDEVGLNDEEMRSIGSTSLRLASPRRTRGWHRLSLTSRRAAVLLPLLRTR